jgi:hypothetical protein
LSNGKWWGMACWLLGGVCLTKAMKTVEVCLTKAVEMIEVCLTKAVKMIEVCLTKAMEMVEVCLTKAMEMVEVCLTKAMETSECLRGTQLQAPCQLVIIGIRHLKLDILIP